MLVGFTLPLRSGARPDASSGFKDPGSGFRARARAENLGVSDPSLHNACFDLVGLYCGFPIFLFFGNCHTGFGIKGLENRA